MHGGAGLAELDFKSFVDSSTRRAGAPRIFDSPLTHYTFFFPDSKSFLNSSSIVTMAPNTAPVAAYALLFPDDIFFSRTEGSKDGREKGEREDDKHLQNFILDIHRRYRRLSRTNVACQCFSFRNAAHGNGPGCFGEFDFLPSPKIKT